MMRSGEREQLLGDLFDSFIAHGAKDQPNRPLGVELTNIGGQGSGASGIVGAIENEVRAGVKRVQGDRASGLFPFRLPICRPKGPALSKPEWRLWRSPFGDGLAEGTRSSLSSTKRQP